MKRLEVSGAVRQLYGSLGVKGLSRLIYKIIPFDVNMFCVFQIFCSGETH